MYVAKVKLESIRGFHDARKVDLDLARPSGDQSGWTVVTGPNGSGRTTLLQAIALAIAGPALAPTLLPSPAAWISSGKQQGGIEIDLVPGEEDKFPRGFQPPEGNVFADLVLTPSGITTESNVGRNGPWQENPPGWFAVGYGPYRQPGAVNRPQSCLAGLFRADVPLNEAASPAALALINDGLLPDGSTAIAEADGLWVEQEGRRLPLRELGDGYRNLIALVLDLTRRLPGPVETATGVVLIDEVEAHLNLPWQQWIGGWLKSHFPRLQFIVSTNSPYVCQASDPGGLISLAGPPRIIDGDLYDRVVHGSGEDVALSELFGLDSPYAPGARRLRHELVELEMKVLDGQANEIQLARYRELQELLVSSPAARATEIAARLQRDKARRRP
ncbi:MAG TPA: AAA family ATPase [Micromonosporaceae bacterium]|nr:AAA family ATPase [Micromonosporaceae bacterium]HCU51113.1 AAA family ATPase [Micromonosporaceae bacterium]